MNFWEKRIMPLNEKKIWFPAKRYGWGWGLPVCWQGWVVIVVWVLLLGAGTFLIPKHPGLYVAYSLVLALVLIIICYLKGEKPRWRWGKD